MLDESNDYVGLYFIVRGFSGGSVVENLPGNAEDLSSIPDPGRSHMPPSN